MPPPANRLVSLDAFRGFIMLLMASSGFGLAQMADAHPDVQWWQAIKFQVSHVDWQWASLWDLIQPSFMFMVGIAVPYSTWRRKQEGQGFFGMLLHALTRSIILILLAVFLSTKITDPQTQWIFTNVLAQIGLGYTFLFIFSRLGWEYCVAAIVVILVGYWFWFFQTPVPTPEQIAALGITNVIQDPPLLPGIAAHWSKNLNAATDFDHWFLNLFPRSTPFICAYGGYTTLNFIPSLATMLGGAVTGEFLQRSQRSHLGKFGTLVIAGALCLMIGTVVGMIACPVVKRIWTPSWVLFSGGWVLLLLSFFYWLVEIANMRRLVFPLVVVGMNSIFIYVMHSLAAPWFRDVLKVHLGPALFANAWSPVIERCGVLFVLWLLCFWLYKQRAFLRL